MFVWWIVDADADVDGMEEESGFWSVGMAGEAIEALSSWFWTLVELRRVFVTRRRLFVSSWT